MTEPDDGALAPPTVILDHVRIDFDVAVDGGGRDKNKGKGKGKGKGGADEGRGARRPRTTTVHAVRSVSAVVRRGEAVGIIGRNGSGKSTLLRAIAGLVPVQGGQVWSVAPPTLLGVDAALLPNLSGDRNIVLGCLALGFSRREIREMKDGIIEFSGLGDAIHRPMRTYSSGMGSRLRFAIATARVPEILLIDEALNTGDAEFRRRSEDRLRSLRGEAGTFFLVSHALGAIAKTCNRALWLDDGVLRMDGPARDVIKAYTSYQAALDEHVKQGGDPPQKPGALVGLDHDLRPVPAGLRGRTPAGDDPPRGARRSRQLHEPPPGRRRRG